MAAPSKLSPIHPFLPTWESSTFLDSTEGVAREDELQVCLWGSWYGAWGWAGAVAYGPGRGGLQGHLIGEGQWLPPRRARRHLWLCPLTHPAPSQGPPASPGSPGAGVSLFLDDLIHIPLPLILSPAVGSGPRLTRKGCQLPALPSASK